MMGVGKSTVGRSIAKAFSYSFIDIDKIIKKEGCSISSYLKIKVKFISEN